MGKYFYVKENNNKLMNVIKNRKYKIICINDVIKDLDFEKCKKEINDTFEKVFSEKSQFEK